MGVNSGGCGLWEGQVTSYRRLSASFLVGGILMSQFAPYLVSLLLPAFNSFNGSLMKQRKLLLCGIPSLLFCETSQCVTWGYNC